MIGNMPMDKNEGMVSEIKKTEEKVSSSSVPVALKEKISAMLERLKYLSHESVFFVEYEHTMKYIDEVLSLPWSTSTQDILDLDHAKQVLDKNHYGLAEVKNKILEYLSVVILKSGKSAIEEQRSFAHAPIISLIGLVG